MFISLFLAPLCGHGVCNYHLIAANAVRVAKPLFQVIVSFSRQ